MKCSRLTYIGLILSIVVMTGVPVVAASAGDDNSWLTPPSIGQSLEFLNTLIPYPSSFSAAGFLPDNDSWVTPATQEQVLAWGAENAKQNAASMQPGSPAVVPVMTLVPWTLGRTDLDRLLGNYKSGTIGPAPSPVPVTPLPTTPAAPPSHDDLHTADGTSMSLLISQAMDKSRANPQVPVTVPATTVVTPVVTPLPAPVPSGGNTDQGTGISLSAFSLQGKYVMISNRGTTPVVMTGWKITNRQGNSLTFIDYPLGGGSTFTYVLNPSSTLTVYFGKDGVMSDTDFIIPGAGISGMLQEIRHLSIIPRAS